MSSDMTLSTLAERINASWHKSTEGVLETGRLCAEAKEKLSDKELEELKEQLTFSPPMFAKLAKIGATEKLYREEVSERLPPHFSIVYQIACLKENEREKAITQGIISPGMTRDDLREWQATQSGKREPTKAERPEVIATLQAPSSFSMEMRNSLMEALRKLKEEFGFLLNGPPDPQDELRQAVKDIDQEIRQETRRYITKVKKLRLHVEGTRRLTKQERHDRWPYPEDQWKIANDADWDRCEEALKLIGVGDEFRRIKDAALRLHGYTEEMLKKHEKDDRAKTLTELKVILTGEQDEQASAAKRKSDNRPATR
jgi:hypothetical protein